MSPGGTAPGSGSPTCFQPWETASSAAVTAKLCNLPSQKSITKRWTCRGLEGSGLPSGVRDPRTGLPVFNLYGKTFSPTPAMRERIDALVFDLQDIGVRYDTFLWTMALAMKAGANAGKPFTRNPQLGARTETEKSGVFTNKKVQAVVETTDKLFCEEKRPEFFVESRDPTGDFGFIVLDRLNPLGGEELEGNMPDPAFASFVRLLPIPVLHGMTTGELAKFFDFVGNSHLIYMKQ